MAAPSSPLVRYRTAIIAAAALIGVLVVAYFFLFGAGPKGNFVAQGANYVCDSLLTPGPSDTLPPPVPSINATRTPLASASAAAEPSASGVPSASAGEAASAAPTAGFSASAPTSAAPSGSEGPQTPVPSPTLRLGFTTQILGRNHLANPNETIEYGFCPPTSGDHYNVAGRGPIRNAVYPSNAEQPPGGWVHNLEHGWVVVLYSCKNGCPSADEMAQMQAWYDQAPTPDASQGCDKEALVARFDSMDTRFAVLAWGRALLTDTFDLNTALTFAQQWTDAGSEPEKTIC